MSGLLLDRYGESVSGASPTALAHLDDAVDHLVHFRGEVVGSVQAALTETPDLTMARVLEAYLGVLGTEPDDAREAAARLATLPRSDTTTERERMHVAAATAWTNGDLTGAGRLLQQVTRDHPRDLLALAVGHQIDFFRGDAVTLRDRIGGALTSWSADDPNYGPLLGMAAFGLEETGQYDRSEQVSLAAVEHDPKDVWGVHAVLHTYEMQGRADAGLRFLQARSADWATGNFLNVHNWWHLCLYLLEARDTTRALAVYDAVLHNDESENLAMEMLDAAALLWRLYLDGDDQTPRWTALADAWAPKMAEPYYAFNDMHAVMSYLGAGRISDAERLVDARAHWVAAGPGTTNETMTREIGLPVCRAVLAFGKQQYAETVALLAPIRHRVNEFGGSHAQRDAVQRTLLEAAIRADDVNLARTLVSERITVRPCSAYAWAKQAQLAERLGRSALAVEAARRSSADAAAAAAAVPDRLPIPA